MIMKLGIVYRNGQIINHRSLIKVLFNPILRYFGIEIATICNVNLFLGKVIIHKCERTRCIKWDFKYNVEYDYIEKKRILF